MSQSTESSDRTLTVATQLDLAGGPASVQSNDEHDAHVGTEEHDEDEPDAKASPSRSAGQQSEMIATSSKPHHDQEDEAPITARSGSRLSPLAVAPEERGFFADGEVGRYPGGAEEFADEVSFAEMQQERPASPVERWASAAVVIAAAAMVGGGLFLLTGWLDQGRPQPVALAVAPSHGGAESADRGETAGEANSEVASAAQTPANPLSAQPPALGEPSQAQPPTGPSAEAAPSDPANAEEPKQQAEAEAPAAEAAPEPAEPAAVRPAEVETAPVSKPEAPKRGAATSGARANAKRATAPLRSPAVASPRPATAPARKSFAASQPSPPSARMPSAPAAPAKKPAAVSFPTN